MKKLVWPFLTMATISLVYLTIYGASQQVLRQSANDPQFQLAEDTAARLATGQSAQAAMEQVVGEDVVQLNQSLAPFVMVFDAAGNRLASNGQIAGQVPVLPIGVLTSTPGNGSHQVTWQPAANVRLAAVVVSYDHGYVLAGRSLKQVEARERRTMLMIGLVWVVNMVMLVVGWAWHYRPGQAKKGRK